MPHAFRRAILGGFAFPIILSLAGCGNSEVGSIKAGPEGAEVVKSKTEGRFKENMPTKPARGKSAKGKADTSNEGIETR
jgi:hypothetical protein